MRAPGSCCALVTVTAAVFTLASLTLGSTPAAFADDPDLEITLVSGPTSATKGAQITILNRVMNQGNVSTASSFTVSLYLSTDMMINPYTDIFLGSRVVPCCLTTLIPPQRVSQANTTVIIPSTVSSGMYYLGAYADTPPPDGVIVESDESNNAHAGTSITIERDADSRGGDSGGGCGTIFTFGEDDHPHSGTITGDFLVLFSLLMFLYVRRNRRRWIRRNQCLQSNALSWATFRCESHGDGFDSTRLTGDPSSGIRPS
jgi:CARDB